MTKSEFHIGDRVYSPFQGYGVITRLYRDDHIYPIIVEWDEDNAPFLLGTHTFTADGYLTSAVKIDGLRITVVR